MTRSNEHASSSAPVPVTRVNIADREIGDGRPVYMIAEAGVNHDGDAARAHALIDAAGSAGVDAVKFQLFSADRLVGKETPACAYQREHDTTVIHQHPMLKRLELPDGILPDLKRHAGDAGLDFLVTPFGLPEVIYLADEIRVPALKIASSDLINEPLLIRAARSGLPIIISTGAGILEEIDRAVACVRKHGRANRLILLHCVSSYPTRPEAARLRCIATLKHRYQVPVGFSDHTREPTTGGFAVMAGAVILEKHLTLDRRNAGPDHFFSLEPDSFADYVKAVRAAERMRGDGRIEYAPEESEVRERARGRVVTARAVAAGDRLTEDTLMIQRPGDGIPPTQWAKIIGRVANRDLPANTPLDWSLLDPPHPPLDAPIVS
ncbi:MAG: N-acetylneuraminate synthase family protein [Phycisphaerae bacterium]